MPIDHESLRRAASAATERERTGRPAGIAGLILDLHRGELAEFITIESGALPPVPLRAESAFGIVVVAPAAGRTWMPWAVVVWSWPDGRVVRRETLPPEVAKPIIIASDAEAFRRSCTSAEAHLQGVPGASTELIGLYRKLVGDAGISLLSAIFPGATDIWGAG